jgi:5-methylcytosine-specific restriction protein B
VIDFTSNGFGTHIDCAQRNGYSINDRTKNYQGWESISVEKVCEMEIKDIVTFVLDYCHRHRRDFLCFGKEYNIKSCIKLLNMEKHIDLLNANKNLILTGAPGTGKTYLAKQIAAQMILGKEFDGKSNEDKKKMNEQCGFVQFHPSYDYTDFIEGLRPIDDGAGNVSFRREDGIFMKFCRKALEAYNNAENKEAAPKYVFIIDEINRGELSKIFGELFFSIDPGYRGENGQVKTQYCNLWKESDKFGGYGTFFIPENVYIIGTMNDIDRSVESMDFAMRRRFAWKEITAESRQSMLDEDEAWGTEGKPSEKVIAEMKVRMDNLNSAIIDQYGDEELSNKDKVGLTKAYQIGAAYFLKYALYNNFEDLWNNHLEGLLREYLRGKTNIKEKIERLHQAYNDTTKH